MAVLRLGDLVPRTHTAAWIAPSATVVGDVEIDADASVFYGAVVRGDKASIRLGRGSNLQDNVVVHADPDFPALIGEDVTVGHSAVLHGCTIGDDVLVGMGAVVLNGARVGAGTLIAAGAVILEGAEIPPGSLVAGLPGKVRRDLSDDERAAILRNAETYCGLARTHAAAG